MNPTLTLATRVNGLLSEYIAINDAILKHSFRKIIPVPGLFKKIDFCRHERNLGGIAQQLEAAMGEIPGLKEARPAHSRFLDAMDAYATALVETMRTLQSISAKLCEKSQGSKDYSWEQYRREMDEYNACVRSYTALGAPLNALLPTIRE